eukprot:996700-Rhodomonas_salina.1
MRSTATAYRAAACWAMRGADTAYHHHTDIARGAITRSAMCGTELAYAATRHQPSLLAPQS